MSTWNRSSHAHAAAFAATHDLPAQALTADVHVFRSARLRVAAQDGDLRMLVGNPDGGGQVQEVNPKLLLGVRKIIQLLVEARGGRLQALSLGFDARTSTWFDIFPEAPADTAWEHWTNPGMTANSQCLECHVTGFEKGYDPATDIYRTTWTELGVGCETCHGARGEHVRRAGAEASAEQARMTPLEACALCHSHRVMITPEFTPDGGGPSDHLSLELLDSDVFFPDGHLRGEGYEWTSFQMSRMAMRGITCLDCHEPHEGRLRAEGNGLCLRCHQGDYNVAMHTHHRDGSSGAVCIACHMPPKVFMERDERRDHYVSRPDPEAAASVGSMDACTTCHRDRGQGWAAEWVRRWYGSSAERDRSRHVTEAFRRARAGDADVVVDLVALLSSHDVDDIRRASAARFLGDLGGGAQIYAVLAATRDPDPVVRAAAVRALGELDPTKDAAQRALLASTRDPSLLVRLEAGNALRDVKLDTVPDEDDRRSITRAFDDWRASQLASVDLPETNFNLGIFETARGNLTVAETAYRRATTLWPADLPPRQNLAMLLVSEGRVEDGATEFQAALDLDPEWPPAAFGLGLLEAGRGHWTDAVQLLERCLHRDPAYPRAAYNLGLAYAQVGDPDRAMQALEQAAQEDVSRRDALREMVRLAYGRGDQAAVHRWLPEALLADPSTASDPRLSDVLRGTVRNPP